MYKSSFVFDWEKHKYRAVIPNPVDSWSELSFPVSIIILDDHGRLLGVELDNGDIIFESQIRYLRKV